MQSLGLLSHASPDAIVAWRGGVPIDRRRFLAEARALAAALPPGRHYLNHCADRYRFAVTLAAGLLSERIALLPSTFNATVAGQLARFAGDAFVIGDGEPLATELPWIPFPDLVAADGDGPVPDIPSGRTVAWVFTSGSTGAPVPHRKTWGKLVLNVRHEAQALGLDRHPGFALVGTVPPQHMYGFESTVLMALQNDGAVVAERPFFPADVVAAILAAPRPRVLVSTPFHLRNLLDAELSLPPLDLLVSATAPLDPALAARAERAFACRLLEIYGSTETSQLATRRTAADEPWTLFPGVTLARRDDAFWASGGHVEVPMPLADVILEEADGRFRLGGRNADLVNIAGKRSSIAYLSHQLTAIPGVVDAAFFMPEDRPDGLARPVAFAVAPGCDAGSILAELRRRIDPVFLPRPLLLVDALPRNATGKLPREACQALLERCREGGRR